MAERRNDERDRLRSACERELAELREADEDEKSEVEALTDAAAKAAARTAHHLSQPDSDGPPARKKHGPGAVLAALVTLGAAAAAVVEALRRAGFIK